jgi:hypothetical protein
VTATVQKKNGKMNGVYILPKRGLCSIIVSLEIIHRHAFFLFKIHRVGDWILSASSGKSLRS